MIADKQDSIGFIFYDIFNLPINIVKLDNSTISYDYDENSQRVYNSYADKYYINNPAGENEAVVDGSDNSKITNNIWGNDQIGQVYRNGSTLTRYYYLKDHLGSIKMRINSDGSVNGYDDYYPYGMVMDGRSSVGHDVRYKFTGKIRDVETNYDYFGARYYENRLGRWLQVDPLADKYLGWSPYNYTLDNPINVIDPNGAYTYTIDGIQIDQGEGQDLMQEYQQEQDLQGNDNKNKQNQQSQSDKAEKSKKLSDLVAGVGAAIEKYNEALLADEIQIARKNAKKMARAMGNYEGTIKALKILGLVTAGYNTVVDYKKGDYGQVVSDVIIGSVGYASPLGGIGLSIIDNSLATEENGKHIGGIQRILITSWKTQQVVNRINSNAPIINQLYYP